MPTHEPIPQQEPTRGSDALVELPVTGWPTAQHTPRTEHGTRYVPEVTAHPAAVVGDQARDWAPLSPGLKFRGLRHRHKAWLIEDGIPEVLQHQRSGHRP